MTANYRTNYTAGWSKKTRLCSFILYGLELYIGLSNVINSD